MAPNLLFYPLTMLLLLILSSFQEYQVPEMLRVPLDGLILQIKTLNLGDASSVLGQAIESPGEPEGLPTFT